MRVPFYSISSISILVDTDEEENHDNDQGRCWWSRCYATYSYQKAKVRMYLEMYQPLTVQSM